MLGCYIGFIGLIQVSYMGVTLHGCNRDLLQGFYRDVIMVLWGYYRGSAVVLQGCHSNAKGEVHGVLDN